MAKATFSRKPTASKVQMSGTITHTGGVVLDADASNILKRIVEAIDGTGFSVEELCITVK